MTFTFEINDVYQNIVDLIENNSIKRLLFKSTIPNFIKQLFGLLHGVPNVILHSMYT